MRKNLRVETERRDERNVARLGIISILSRIDPGVTTWQSAFSVRGRAFKVECAAPYGSPHGIDTDVILAIQTLFVRQGCPEHGCGKLLEQGEGMLTDQKLPGYRFPLSIIGHAVWLYHHYTLSYRDVEELLLERGIQVSHESIRSGCAKFSEEFA